MTDRPDNDAPSKRWRRAPALSHAGFRRVLAMRICNNLGINGLVVAVGWEVYDIGRDPFDLGLIGLVQVAPAMLLVLVTGTVSDRYDRRIVAVLAYGVLSLTVIAILILSLAGLDRVWPFIGLMTVVGTARAFVQPNLHALIPNVVPSHHLPNAVALNAIAARTGAGAGPLIGGVLYDIGPTVAYGGLALVFLTGAGLAGSIPKTDQVRSVKGTSLAILTAGFKYIGRTKVLLGAITFDVFAVLMTGVNSLLPVFARDVLAVGPSALGLLRAAPAAGAALVALTLSLYPLRRRAGTLVFSTTALFGLAAVAFGLSTTLWLSVLALFVMGAADMAGGYFRWSVVQLWTPDDLRGRVSAVTSVSGSGATGLGDFRAGVMAALLGPVAAVALGGIVTVAGVFLGMRLFPEFRRLNSLERPK